MNSIASPNPHLTLSNAYPKARKLQHELQTTLDYLKSGRGGGEVNMQQRAREDMSQLHQLLSQLESLIHTEPESSREMWRKKIHLLQENFHHLQHNLESYLIRQNPHVVQRNSLLSRRTGAMQTSDQMYSTQESQSLQRSSEAVSNLTLLSESVMANLTSQGTMLKSAHKKVLDVAARLGMTNSMLRIIERRDFMDKLITFGGMVFVLLFLAFCYWYAG